MRVYFKLLCLEDAWPGTVLDSCCLVQQYSGSELVWYMQHVTLFAYTVTSKPLSMITSSKAKFILFSREECLLVTVKLAFKP
jgi:hypothetical protein